MSNFIKSYQTNVGLNHTPAYQVSGRPFTTGSVNCTSATKISFPYVTRWVWVVNRSADVNQDARVGFSEIGVNGDNYFVADAARFAAHERGRRGPVLKLKVSEIWISGSSDVDIVAGLTTIPTTRTTTTSGPSFSGSVGVG
tara:strand:- start:68 stop:490 length:423 start_codon:yes stop_codon:yes gene_type:complete